jgi:hypothetical protein
LQFSKAGLLPQQPLGQLPFHVIEASPLMEKFPMSSKRNNYPPLLAYLRDLGWQTADAWMAQNRSALSKRSTLDLQQLLPVSVWGSMFC